MFLFHLWPERVTGGYVGVDVFFVISGFLITSHLLREISLNGGIRVGRFWARRAKRLLPASLTVLLLTALATVAFVPQSLWNQFLSEVIASTLYVENWLLAANSVDYLALENAASPSQHFWTLSVEEQFYVALPLLLLAVVMIVRRIPDASRTAMATVLAIVVSASFAYSIWLTATTPTVAYFSTFTRAWEFGAGALLAFVTIQAGKRASRLLVPVGIALIIASCLLFTTDTPFPGAAAAVPVVGTVLVLWAGRESFVSRIGDWWPVATLGHISYSVYLWHWPLIIFLPYVTGRPLSGIEKVLILLATLVIAWLSTRFIEEPVRFSPRLLGNRRPITVAAWTALGMSVVLAVSATGLVVADTRDRAHKAALVAVKSETLPCLGAQAMDAELAPCVNGDLDGMLVPDPAIAKSDDDNMGECWGVGDGGKPRICTLAAPKGYDKYVLAVGDSHNNTLIGAYRTMAEAHGWRMEVAGIPGCYLTTAEQRSFSDSHRRSCEHWRAGIFERIKADPPDALIVTHSSGDNLVIPGPNETVESATVDGLVDAWSALPSIPIIAIRDNPAMTKDTARCVAKYRLEAAEQCSRPRAEALAFDGQAEAAERVDNAHVIDLTDLYCTADTCPPVIGHVLVYRDPRHVTATWVRTMTPYLDREIIDALGW